MEFLRYARTYVSLRLIPVNVAISCWTALMVAGG
jgi:hypothetical protein